MSLGRPPRTVVWMMLAAVALLVFSIAVLHGTPPGHVRVGHGLGTVSYTRTRPIDIVRIVLDIAAIALALYALARWGNARDAPPREEEAQRHYGDSILDARTSVDPVVGMRPVNSEPPRH